MRKMMAGLLVLVILLCAGIYNAAGFRSRMRHLEDYVEAASILSSDGDHAEAVKLLESAIGKWREMEDYTHIFIRHSEIDAVSDAFYDYLSAMRSSGKDDQGARDKLLYHLKITAELEIATFGAIF